MRLFPLVLLLSTSAFAQRESPDWTKNAFVLGLEYGYGIWGMDQTHIANQVGTDNAALFVGELHNTQTATVRIGFDILGYVTVEGALTGTGWSITQPYRGGGGFLPFLVNIHPLRFFVQGPHGLDVGIFGGMGYGIVGQDRGMDGLIECVGLRLSYFFNSFFGLTLSARDEFMGFKSFYVDWNNRQQAGNTLPLPQGSGGTFIALGAGIELRFAP